MAKCAESRAKPGWEKKCLKSHTQEKKKPHQPNENAVGRILVPLLISLCAHVCDIRMEKPYG